MVQARAMNLKNIAAVVRLKKPQVREMSSSIEIWLLTSGPSSATSKWETEFFKLNIKEYLEDVKERISDNYAPRTSNMEILVDEMESIVDWSN